MATNLQFVKAINSTDVVSVTATDLFNTQELKNHKTVIKKVLEALE